LRDYLDEFVKAPITMIFGAMRDKALGEIAAILFPAAHELILTEIENQRTASLEMIRRAIPEDFRGRLRRAVSVDDAWRQAIAVTPANGLICVTGSLYLVGAAQSSAVIIKASAGARDRNPTGVR
jgi:dihydrofolate synthase/folylpolyglutamate synthase